MQVLTAGARFGPYEVQALIGHGGMGEVFKAHDTRLKRDVALKVLPPAVAADADRRARFEREAQALAALNHPHIAAIHGVEESNGTRALVMEFVDGLTLADRLVQGPIPLDEVLQIAGEVAEALEAAHDRGIIHRDLKPANVKVTPDGAVKVLDFGLAKAVDPAEHVGDGGRAGHALANSPTLTSLGLTSAGVILGTAAYMSPEQARGKPVDKRADIWAFGVVVYEMLTGRPAFAGDDVSEILAAVLRQEIDWRVLPPSTPAGVRWVLGRCLERDPKERLRDAGEARIALSRLGFESVAVGNRASGKWKSAVAVVSSIVLTAILIGWLATWSRASGTLPVRIVDVSDTVAAVHAAISPDGSTLAYAKPDGLWLRRLDRPTGTRIISGGAIGSIAWSPEGDALAFFAGADVRTVRLDGGGEKVLWRPEPVEVFRSDVGLVWSGGAVYVPSRRGIVQVPLGTSKPTMILEWYRKPAVGVYRHPVVFKDGRVLVVNPNVGGDRFDFGTVWAFDQRVGEQILSFPQSEVVGLEYLETTRELLISTREPSRRMLWAAPFDPERLQAGTPQPVIEGQIASPPAHDGTLALITGLGPLEWKLRWIDSRGTELRVVPQQRLDPRNLALAPNGRYLAFRGIRTQGEAGSLWIHDLERGVDALVASPLNAVQPAWSPDSRMLAFTSVSGASTVRLRLARLGQSQDPRTLAEDARGGSPTWTPDGRDVIYSRGSGDDGEVAAVASDASGPARPIGRISQLRGSLALSPDGKLLAYEAGAVGREVVMVTTFPELSVHIPVSGEGGRLPQWHPKRNELWLAQANQVVAVPISRTPGGDVTAGSPRVLLTAPADVPLWSAIGGKQYATADGEKFLVNSEVVSGEPRVTLIQNAPELVRRARQ